MLREPSSLELQVPARLLIGGLLRVLGEVVEVAVVQRPGHLTQQQIYRELDLLLPLISFVCRQAVQEANLTLNVLTLVYLLA